MEQQWALPWAVAILYCNPLGIHQENETFYFVVAGKQVKTPFFSFLYFQSPYCCSKKYSFAQHHLPDRHSHIRAINLVQKRSYRVSIRPKAAEYGRPHRAGLYCLIAMYQRHVHLYLQSRWQKPPVEIENIGLSWKVFGSCTFLSLSGPKPYSLIVLKPPRMLFCRPSCENRIILEIFLVSGTRCKRLAPDDICQKIPKICITPVHSAPSLALFMELKPDSASTYAKRVQTRELQVHSNTAVPNDFTA